MASRTASPLTPQPCFLSQNTDYRRALGITNRSFGQEQDAWESCTLLQVSPAIGPSCQGCTSETSSLISPACTKIINLFCTQVCHPYTPRSASCRCCQAPPLEAMPRKKRGASSQEENEAIVHVAEESILRDSQ